MRRNRAVPTAAARNPLSHLAGETAVPPCAGDAEPGDLDGWPLRSVLVAWCRRDSPTRAGRGACRDDRRAARRANARIPGPAIHMRPIGHVYQWGSRGGAGQPRGELSGTECDLNGVYLRSRSHRRTMSRGWHASTSTIQGERIHRRDAGRGLLLGRTSGLLTRPSESAQASSSRSFGEGAELAGEQAASFSPRCQDVS